MKVTRLHSASWQSAGPVQVRRPHFRTNGYLDFFTGLTAIE
jgi:hypothetical protein